MAGGCFYLRDGVFHGDAPAAPPDHFQVDEVVSKGGYIRKGDAAEGCDVPDGGELFRVPRDEAAELGAGEADQGAVGVAAGDRLRLLGAVQLRRDLEGGPAEGEGERFAVGVVPGTFRALFHVIPGRGLNGDGSKAGAGRQFPDQTVRCLLTDQKAVQLFFTAQDQPAAVENGEIRLH